MCALPTVNELKPYYKNVVLRFIKSGIYYFIQVHYCMDVMVVQQLFYSILISKHWDHIVLLILLFFVYIARQGMNKPKYNWSEHLHIIMVTALHSAAHLYGNQVNPPIRIQHTITWDQMLENQTSEQLGHGGSILWGAEKLWYFTTSCLTAHLKCCFENYIKSQLARLLLLDETKTKNRQTRLLTVPMSLAAFNDCSHVCCD